MGWSVPLPRSGGGAFERTLGRGGGFLPPRRSTAEGAVSNPATDLISAMQAPTPLPLALAALGQPPPTQRGRGEDAADAYSPQVTPPRMLVTRSAPDWPVAKPKS